MAFLVLEDANGMVRAASLPRFELVIIVLQDDRLPFRKFQVS